MMTHIKTITKGPALAESERATLGQMLSVVVEMLRVLTTALTAKNATSTTTSS